MKIYGRLTRQEKAKAIDKALEELVNCVANGLISFTGKLQVKIDLAIKTANDNNMQWSIQEHILEVAKPELLKHAQGIAEDATYKENGDFLKVLMVV